MTTPAPERVRELVAELRRLHGKATSGPWQHYAGRLRPQSATKIHEVQRSDGAPLVAWGGFDGVKNTNANADLIVAMRNALPDLLAAAEAGVTGIERLAPQWATDRIAVLEAERDLERSRANEYLAELEKQDVRIKQLQAELVIARAALERGDG